MLNYIVLALPRLTVPLAVPLGCLAGGCCGRCPQGWGYASNAGACCCRPLAREIFVECNIRCRLVSMDVLLMANGVVSVLKKTHKGRQLHHAAEQGVKFI